MSRVLRFILLALVTVAFVASCGKERSPIGAGPQAALGSLEQPAGISPAEWQALKDELARVMAVYKSTSAVPAPPMDPPSKVCDLQVSGSPGGSATFTFTFRSTGDYDQNGEVNISDLTTLGANYLKRSTDPGWAGARVADGDRNGEVNIADITPIGAHYNVSVSGYELMWAYSEDGPWIGMGEVPLSSGVRPTGGGFLKFTTSTTAQAGDAYYCVWPYFGDGAEREYGVPSMNVFLGTSQLAAPTILSATTAYNDHIGMSWTKVAGATGYEVYRDALDPPLASLGDVGTYDDTTVADFSPHTYWVRALDATRTSNYSAPAIGQRASSPPEIEPPGNVQATDGSVNDRVTVTWNKPAGATGYELYRDIQSVPSIVLGDVATYDDTSLADTQQHTYWVVALKGLVRSAFSLGDSGFRGGTPDGTMVVLGYNDLGMHCMNQDFSELMILPPYNTLHATVILRGIDPQIVTSGVEVRYSIPGNTYSVGKTNFWDFTQPLFGTAIEPNVGLTGNGLWGTMQPSGTGFSDWDVTGIPITPLKDDNTEDPFQLASIAVFQGGVEKANTQSVVPVSWEISCDLCHVSATGTPSTDILAKHDMMHGTALSSMKPVSCGMCHPQPELGKSGLAGYPTLSSAIHSAHASRVNGLSIPNKCYACHPGQQTECLRDVHYSAGLNCTDCHGTMADVGNPARQPWVDLPRCDSCHTRAGFEFEQPGVLYRNSRGHNGVQCEACHGSTHAIYPSVVAADNVQSIALQGHPGKIDTCTVCHTEQPDDPFPHVFSSEP